MGRFAVLLLCVVVLVIQGIAIGVASDEGAQGSGEEMCIPMGEIILEAPESVEAQRSSVTFPHSLHFTINCMTCHHEWSADEPVEGCMSCHDLEEAPAPEDRDEAMMYYKNAYHQMCIGCHKEIKTMNREAAQSTSGAASSIKPTGPTSCVKCHPKG